jgi:hypothetical protein
MTSLLGTTLLCGTTAAVGAPVDPGPDGEMSLAELLGDGLDVGELVVDWLGEGEPLGEGEELCDGVGEVDGLSGGDMPPREVSGLQLGDPLADGDGPVEPGTMPGCLEDLAEGVDGGLTRIAPGPAP